MRRFLTRGLRSRPLAGLAGLVLGAVVLLGAIQLSHLPIFLASFTGVPDGPGNGQQFPAEIGQITTFTGGPQPFPVVAPNAGIEMEQLMLTNEGGIESVDFGVQCEFTELAELGMFLAFDFCTTTVSQMSVEITDTSGVDIAGFTFSGDGDLYFNGSLSRVRHYLAPRLHVEIWVRDRGGNRTDTYAVILRDADNGGTLGVWTGELPGQYRPAAAVNFTSLGGGPSNGCLDFIQVYELVQGQ